MELQSVLRYRPVSFGLRSRGSPYSREWPHDVRPMRARPQVGEARVWTSPGWKGQASGSWQTTSMLCPSGPMTNAA